MSEEPVTALKADALLQRIMQGFEALEALDVERFEADLVGDLQVILAYLDFEERMQLIELLMEKSEGRILEALTEFSQSQEKAEPSLSRLIIQSFHLYQQQQTFNAVFAPEAVDHVCKILSEGK